MCLAFGVGVADAASYEVRACQAASEYGYANNSWQPFNTAPTFFTTSVGCPTAGGQSGGIHVGERLEVVGYTPNGSGAGWRFDAPAGTSITGLTYARYLGQWGDNAKVPALRDDSGAVIGTETCTFDGWSSECSVGSASPTVATRTITGLSTDSLTAGITCQSAPPAISCGGSTRYGMNSWFSIFSASVTITQTTAPTVSAATLPGGWTRTVPVASVTSTDPSGARAARAYLDSVRVADDVRSCDFSRPVPCTNLDAAPVTLGTPADGTHSVVLAATNAAGLEGRTAAQTLRIDRTPPPPPAAVSFDAGSNWQTSATTIARWSLPTETDRAPITAASYQLCEAATEQCTSPAATDSLESTVVTVPREGTYMLRVWLTDAAGNTAPSSPATAAFRYASTPPGSPIALTSNAGDGWQRSASVALSWSTPATGAGAAVTGALYQRCGPSGCDTPIASGNPTSATATLPHDGSHTLRVWLVNAAGLADPATARDITVRYDATAPRPPADLAITPASPATTASIAARWSPPPADGGSPYTTSRWTLCNGGRCPLSGETSAGTAAMTVPTPGAWTLSVHHLDAAGNVSEPASVGYTYTLTGNRTPVDPPQPPRPGPEDPPPTTRRPAVRAKTGLRIGSARVRGRVLHVAVAADRRLTVSAQALVRYAHGRTRRSVRRTLAIRRGRASLRMRLPAGVRGGSISVRTSKTATFLAGSASARLIGLPASRVGQRR